MRFKILLPVISVIVLVCGCASNKTRLVEGTLIGGVLGAAAGGIIGHQSNHGAEGALIGAVAGSAAGAAVGSRIEKQPEPAVTREQQPAAEVQQAVTVNNPSANPNQITTAQIVAMVKQGVDDKVVIDKILLSGSRYSFSAEEIVSLRTQGVSQMVIDTMVRK
ncbi:MAG: YMGG-like glycine zipper-containing protein [Candidatus Omnitrophota bacterium]